MYKLSCAQRTSRPAFCARSVPRVLELAGKEKNRFVLRGETKLSYCGGTNLSYCIRVRQKWLKRCGGVMTEQVYTVWGFGCKRAAKLLRLSGIQLYSLRHVQQFFRTSQDIVPPRCLLIYTPNLKTLQADKLVRSLRQQWPMVDVVLWSPRAGAHFVRRAFKQGAKDVVLSDKIEDLVDVVDTIIEEQRFLPRMNELNEDFTSSSRFEGLVSRSPEMWDLFHTCINIAETDATVLILGETGTGKELIARALHRRSGRKGAFVVLDCGAVPEQLINSELFGHVKGAFTGAMHDKKGLFRHADGGTLFLDELASIPLEVQFRLLRTLQEGTIRPVGGHEELPVDVRVIAATNEALDKKVQDGTFREDLMYRLSVLYLTVPPLRERQEDILFLFAYFLRKLSEQYNMERPSIQDDFLDGLLSYSWPGNVRQLENFVERLVLTNANKVVSLHDFNEIMGPFQYESGSEAKAEKDKAPLSSLGRIFHEGQDMKAFLHQAERLFLEYCLRSCAGHVGKSAELAGVSRRSFTRKMRQHHLLREQFLEE